MKIKLKPVGVILRPVGRFGWEIGKHLLAFLIVLLVTIGPIAIGVAYDRWERWQDSYFQKDFTEQHAVAHEDGGYAVEKQSLTTYFPASKKVQTKTSLELKPLKTNTFFPDSTAWGGIKVWDYNSDGHWDAIFFCGYPESANGCNSILLGKDPKDWLSWKWSPCRYDAEHGVAMIDGCAIEHALDLVQKYENM